MLLDGLNVSHLLPEQCGALKKIHTTSGVYSLEALQKCTVSSSMPICGRSVVHLLIALQYLSELMGQLIECKFKNNHFQA